MDSTERVTHHILQLSTRQSIFDFFVCLIWFRCAHLVHGSCSEPSQDSAEHQVVSTLLQTSDETLALVLKVLVAASHVCRGLIIKCTHTKYCTLENWNRSALKDGKQIINTHFSHKENKSTDSWHVFDDETRPITQFQITYYYQTLHL